MTKAELRVELAKAQNDAEEKAKAALAAKAAAHESRLKVKGLSNALREAERTKEAPK
jgi:hypothetical protein